MRRISDVWDRHYRGFPVIIHAGFNTTTPGIVLHISEEIATIDSRSGFDKQAQLTKCSRVSEDWHVYTGAGYDEWEPREIVKAVKHLDYDFKFCRSCGTDADFEAAIDGYWVHREAEAVIRKEREKAEAEIERAKRVQQEFELQRFLHAYVTADAPLERDGKFRFAYKVPGSGVVISVEADWEDE